MLAPAHAPCFVAGMEAHPFAPMVQLSALLCLVPLTLNHLNMQVQLGPAVQFACLVDASSALLRCGCCMPQLLLPPPPQPVCPISIPLHTFLHSQSTLQVTVAKICLPHILAAVRNNVGELEVVSKGLILLGVLCQARWLEHVAHEHRRCIRHALHWCRLCYRVE